MIHLEPLGTGAFLQAFVVGSEMPLPGLGSHAKGCRR
jgi:hypothetical protein